MPTEKHIKNNQMMNTENDTNNKNNFNKQLQKIKPQKFNNLWIIMIILTGLAIMWTS